MKEQLAALGVSPRAIMAARMPVDDFPYLAEFTIQHVMRPGYDTGEEFESFALGNDLNGDTGTTAVG